MKNLFKEVWNSFSKSKLLLGSLISLIFMTSGVITLIFDVVHSYKTKLNDYKTASNLHDVTMEANLKIKGTSPNEFYIYSDSKNNFVDNQWEHIEINKNIDGIMIDSNLEFINLNNYSNDITMDLFVRTKELSDLINLNLYTGTSFSDLTGQTDATFNLNLDGKHTIKTYSLVNGEYIENSKPDEVIYSIKGLLDKYDANTQTWSSTYLANNLYKKSFLTSGFNQIIIDKETKLAYLESVVTSNKNSEIYKKYSTSKENFLILTAQDVANLLGFVEDIENINILSKNYLLDTSKDWILDGDISLFPNNLDFDDFFKRTDIPKIKETFDLNFPLPIDNKEKIISLTIPKNWFVYSNYKYVYTKHEKILNGVSENGDIDKNIWDGYFYEYLTHLKETNEEKFDELVKTSYWEKEIIITKVDSQGNLIQIDKDNNSSYIKNNELKFNSTINEEDITKKIIDKNGNETTIAEIEGIIIPIVNLNSIPNLNQDLSTNNKNYIEVNAKNFKTKQIYQNLSELVDKMGLRQALTINSTNNNKTNVYKFINLGNSNNEINWNGIDIKQEVGKLIETDNSNPIFSNTKSIENNLEYVPSKYISEIIEKLLNGFSLNREYINPMISFESFDYLDNDGNLQSTTNSKIIWLTKNGNIDPSYTFGIAKVNFSDSNEFKYYILFANKKNWDSKWSVLDSYENGISNINVLDDYIVKNNLTFAPYDMYGREIEVVSDKGWARQDPDYSDKFSIAYQYLLPNSQILEDYNNADKNNNIYGLESLKETLISSLTLELKNLISPWHWEILMQAINTSFSSYGFVEGWNPPAEISQSTLIKVIIGVFRDAIISTNDNIINSIFGNIFDNLERELNPNGNSSIEEQQNILRTYLDSIFRLISLLGGGSFTEQTILDFVNLLTEGNYTDLSKVVTNPTLFISSLKSLINSINWDQAILEIWNNFYVNDFNENRIIGTGDFLPYIYRNIYSTKTIISSIQNLLKSTALGKVKVTKVLEILNIELSSLQQWFLGSYDLESFIEFIVLLEPEKGYLKLVKETKKVYNDKFNVEYKTIELKKILELISIEIASKNINIGDQVPVGIGTDIIYDPNKKMPLELDLDFLWYLNQFVFVDPESNNDLSIGEINFKKIVSNSISAFTEIKDDYNQIILNENLGKIAIVNQAFLNSNSKEVYKSKTLINDLNDLSKINDKYKINISGVEYLIVGADFSVDYMYPIINSENINVNTNNQALVYVNQYGYDRIKRSFPSAPSEEYFLFTTQNGQTAKELQTELNILSYELATGEKFKNIVDVNSNSNIYKTTYLTTESSPFNPERSLRLTVIYDMISNLERIEQIVGIMLLTIVGLVMLFVVRRYIIQRSKALGILKAQGYSSFEIALSICLFPLFASVIGSILGYIVGLVSQFALSKLFSIFWTVPFVSIPFNWLSFGLTLIIPIVFLSLITIFGALLFLKNHSSLNMMNGSMDVSENIFTRFVKLNSINTSIRNKFSISLAFGSLGKLFALFISSLFTSGVTLFYISSYKAFDKSIVKTYKNKNYKYLISYQTPTIEGGKLQIIQSTKENPINVENMLYVPIGIPEEGYTYLSNYFKPGYNEILNKDNKNGQLDLNDTTTPHIFTKFSMDLSVSTGGLNTNVWETLYNSLPEAQRAILVNASYESGNWIEWTQENQEYDYNGKIYKTRFVDFDTETEYLSLWDENINDYLKIWNSETNQNENIKIPYFNYVKDSQILEDSKFIKRESIDNINYSNKDLIITGDEQSDKLRSEYRSFLVNAYNMMLNFDSSSFDDWEKENMPIFKKDFFMSPGAVFLDVNEQIHINEETFTYIDSNFVDNNSISPKIYGFKIDSQINKVLDEKGNNLLKKAEEFVKEINGKKVYPLIINKVSEKKYNLKQNQIISLKINNHYLRFEKELSSQIINFVNEQESQTEILEENVLFEIIGISDTYINEEWITTQKNANEILGLEENSFNGIISNSNEPSSISSQLSLMAINGYWSADNKIFNSNILPSNLTISEKAKIINTYNQIFYNVKTNNEQTYNNSLFANNLKRLFPNYSSNEIDDLIKRFLNQETLELKFNPNDEDQSINDKNVGIANEAINKFISIYSDSALEASLNSVLSNGIEKEFIEKASLMNEESITMIAVLSFIISLIILILITSMLITENEKNIAIFGILGYSTKEKIKMFISIFIPVIFASILSSILLVWLVLPIFISIILNTTSIVLPISLNIIQILISSIIIIFLFIITFLVVWFAQGRIKPILLLKEE